MVIGAVACTYYSLRSPGSCRGGKGCWCGISADLAGLGCGMHGLYMQLDVVCMEVGELVLVEPRYGGPLY